MGGYLWVPGETDYAHLEDGVSHPLAPGVKKAEPTWGICLFDGKVIAIRYCPDGYSEDLTDREKIDGRKRMKNAMTWTQIENDLEGAHITVEIANPGEMTVEHIQALFDARDRR